MFTILKMVLKVGNLRLFKSKLLLIIFVMILTLSGIKKIQTIQIHLIN